MPAVDPGGLPLAIPENAIETKFTAVEHVNDVTFLLRAQSTITAAPGTDVGFRLFDPAQRRLPAKPKPPADGEESK
ncbi:MAG TPA: hypothetical protein VGJ05_08000 [Fimbriiglobus sp.]